VDLDRVRAFVVTADHRNFTRAADELGLAQPSLSARIRGLEQELGVTLFSRSKRQIELTAAGREFLGHARRLLAAADEAVAATIDAARGSVRERMVMTTLAASVDELKAGLLMVIRRLAPELAVSLTGVGFAEHVSVLHDRRADAAFLWPPYTAAATAGLHLEPVRDFPRVLALPAGHPLAARAHVTTGDLAGLAQIPLVDGIDPVFVSTWRLVAEPVTADVTPAATVADLLTAIAAGTGCCPVPELLARTSAVPGVAFVPLAGAPPATLTLAWRRDVARPRHAMLAQAAAAVGG
jgi:DNA-binding transcriptional LysR family regulator